jgi:hypothetical protein
MIGSQNDMEQSQTNHFTLNHTPSHPPDLGSSTRMLSRKLKELEHKLDAAMRCVPKGIAT